MKMQKLLSSDVRDTGVDHCAALQHGVLPWRDGRRTGLRILLVKSGDEAGWSVPLGAPVEGRAPFLSAALHAFEEAGIIGEIDTVPLSEYRRGGTGDRVVVHAMQVRGTLSHWKRQHERQRQWFAPAEAADRVDDAGLAELIRSLADQPQRLTQVLRTQRAWQAAAAPEPPSGA
jgi:predicted NUDIX family NTP pyrophosphohydrolase